jgi:crotonobetaine/carnitine-CoA ligase
MTVPELVRDAARDYGERVALVSIDGGTVAFGELVARVAGAAGALAGVGATPGDRVLIKGANSIEMIYAWLGAMWVGAIPAAVNPALTEREVIGLVEDLEPAVLLADRTGSGLGDALATRADVPLLGLGYRASGGQFSTAGQPAEMCRGDATDTAAIVYTSGTTSRPKGVLVSHAAYEATGRAVPSWLGLGERETLYACLPLFHINAQAYSLMTALVNGYGLAVTGRFSASTFWRDAARMGVTEANVMGSMLAMLEAQPSVAAVPNDIRVLFVSPGPAPARRDSLEHRFGVRIVTGYGMTECTFGCFETGGSRSKDGSVGSPRQPITEGQVNEMRIVDPLEQDLPPGRIGQVLFRNPYVSAGYWRNPVATAELLRDGWLRTGDLGEVDAAGDLFLRGRIKEMIRRRGENISPAEIEEVLLTHPSIRDAVAFGVASDLSEEEVVACVVLAPGQRLDVEALLAQCLTALAPYKIPSEIHQIDVVPVTPTMRIARSQLRARHTPRGTDEGEHHGR